jgi:hypothetical protein
LNAIDEKILRYLAELDQQDAQTVNVTALTADALTVKLAHLRTRQEHYQSLQHQLEQSGQPQLSLTDPDSRSMPVGQGTAVAFNVQIAVDSKHKLIVTHDVTNAGTDHAQLAPMAQAAKQTLDATTLNVTADMGYYDGEAIKRCLAEGVTPYLPKPHTSRSQKRGLYTKDDFIYNPEHDRYHCPQKAELEFRYATVENGRPMRYYATTACHTCQAKARCTTNKSGRRITRWADEHLLDLMADRVQAHPEIMRQRKVLAEHPFGTMKRTMQQGYFLMKGLIKVNTEVSLTVLAYNLKRAMTTRSVGVPKLIAAVT